MSNEHIDSVQAAADAVANAELALINALELDWNEDGTTDLIVAAMRALQAAQARHTAARTGLRRLPDLVR